MFSLFQMANIKGFDTDKPNEDVTFGDNKILKDLDEKKQSTEDKDDDQEEAIWMAKCPDCKKMLYIEKGEEIFCYLCHRGYDSSYVRTKKEEKSFWYNRRQSQNQYEALAKLHTRKEKPKEGSSNQ